MNNHSALMYNLQNLYGSIAGINNKIFELENQISKQKSPPPQASNQTEVENKIAQLVSTVDALKKNHAVFETQLGELKNSIKISNTQDIASISLAQEVTPAADEVFELVPPKPKGGRKKKA